MLQNLGFNPQILNVEVLSQFIKLHLDGIILYNTEQKYLCFIFFIYSFKNIKNNYIYLKIMMNYIV